MLFTGGVKDLLISRHNLKPRVSAGGLDPKGYQGYNSKFFSLNTFFLISGTSYKKKKKMWASDSGQSLVWEAIAHPSTNVNRLLVDECGNAGRSSWRCTFVKNRYIWCLNHEAG